MPTKREQWTAGFWDAEPGPYDTLETWEHYLKMVEAMDFAPDAIPSKASLLRRAREIISWNKREAREFEAEQVCRRRPLA